MNRAMPTITESADELKGLLCAHLDQYTDAVAQSLTGYPYLRQAINAVFS